MKKQFFKTTSIKVYTTALATSLILLTGFSAARAADKIATNSNAQISYVGAENNLLAFNINFKNEEELSFTIKLTDELGQVWYKKSFTDKNLDKNIFIKNIGDITKLNFTIISAKNSLNQSFEINTQTTVVEEVIVTKI